MSDEARRKFDERRVTDLCFLREQDGPNERSLKKSLRQLFQQNQAIERAYLVLAQLQGRPTVILGLATQCGPDMRMVNDVQFAFASVCNVKEHLDIVFLTAEQEAHLVEVCQPFYNRS